MSEIGNPQTFSPLTFCTLLVCFFRFIGDPESCEDVQRSKESTVELKQSPIANTQHQSSSMGPASNECSIDIEKYSNARGTKRSREDSASPVQSESELTIETPVVLELSSDQECSSNESGLVIDLSQCF